MKYFILKNLQEMANDWEQEIFIDTWMLAFVLPHLSYMLQW
jgi:hypothetical protein